jgi:hypothetical protein
MVSQLDFEKKMDLIRAISREPSYRVDFYAYTEALAKTCGIPPMTEEELDDFLHTAE